MEFKTQYIRDYLYIKIEPIEKTLYTEEEIKQFAEQLIELLSRCSGYSDKVGVWIEATLLEKFDI